MTWIRYKLYFFGIRLLSVTLTFDKELCVLLVSIYKRNIHTAFHSIPMMKQNMSENKIFFSRVLYATHLYSHVYQCEYFDQVSWRYKIITNLWPIHKV